MDKVLTILDWYYIITNCKCTFDDIYELFYIWREGGVVRWKEPINQKIKNTKECMVSEKEC